MGISRGLQAAILIVAGGFSGCQHKQHSKIPPPPATMAIGKDCILGGTPVSTCDQVTPNLALCHDVYVKYTCVQAITKPKEGKK